VDSAGGLDGHEDGDGDPTTIYPRLGGGIRSSDVWNLKIGMWERLGYAPIYSAWDFPCLGIVAPPGYIKLVKILTIPCPRLIQKRKGNI
jgi:hypothetical protein